MASSDNSQPGRLFSLDCKPSSPGRPGPSSRVERQCANHRTATRQLAVIAHDNKLAIQVRSTVLTVSLFNPPTWARTNSFDEGTMPSASKCLSANCGAFRRRQRCIAITFVWRHASLNETLVFGSIIKLADASCSSRKKMQLPICRQVSPVFHLEFVRKVYRLTEAPPHGIMSHRFNREGGYPFPIQMDRFC
jgi:hypothetical protein